MKYTVKLVLDLSEIKRYPELRKSLYKEKKPIKVATVRNSKIVGAKEIDIEEIRKNASKIPVNIEFDDASKEPRGIYVLIGPNVAEREFLAIETKKIWISPKRFKKNIADLTKDKIAIHKELFKRWLWLCRTFTITGRVVKRVKTDSGYCDEAVPGAKVEAYDVDCWWFWWKRDLVGSAITNPDGTFEIKFRWCCLLWFHPPIWVIDPDLLRYITKVIKPHIGPIPPEVLKSPVEFEEFLTGKIKPPVSPQPKALKTSIETEEYGKNPIFEVKDLGLVKDKTMVTISPLKDLIAKIRPILPILPCWPFRPRDCTPDIVFKVTQDCDGEENIIYDESPFQTRWNIPTNLNVTLFANEKACSVPDPLCEELPPGDCLKFTKINCIFVKNIGTDIGPPDLRGYAYPGSTHSTYADNPFAETIRVKGLFGAGSDIDYFKVQYSYNGGVFKDMPKENLIGFTRSYWAPPPGSPPSTPAKWNHVSFIPHEVDGETVYKTLKKAEEENPLPAGWTWGYLWNDLDTLFLWNSKNLEGDGLYTLRLVGYRWNETTNKLENEHIMQTCEIEPVQEERVMIRIDNRDADDPLYELNEARPCGPGTIHLCTYEPDCDFIKVAYIKSGTTEEDGIEIKPCDIIELTDDDDIVIYFNASDRDGHLLGYEMKAHWGENEVFNVLANGTLQPEDYPNQLVKLVGPLYKDTLIGSQGIYRSTLPATDPEHDRPYWFGGNFKVTVTGEKFNTCAYTLKLHVWKRTMVGCQKPSHVHANWCSYSFTIEKV